MNCRAPHSRAAAIRIQNIEAFGPQAIGRREGAVEVGKVDCRLERGQFVDNDLRPGGERRRANGRPIERVDHDRLRAPALQRLGLLSRARKADNRMSPCDKQRNETRSDRSRGARDHHAHDWRSLRPDNALAR